MLKSFAAAFLVTIASAAQGVTTVDQSNLVTLTPGESVVFAPNGMVQTAPGVFNDVVAAQMITAGKNGLLSSVDLQLTGFPNTMHLGQVTLTVADNVVIDPSGGLQSAHIVGRVNFAVSSLQTGYTAATYNVDLSSLGFQVTPGKQFALALQEADQQAAYFGWAVGSAMAPYHNGDPVAVLNYSGGDAYRQQNSLDGPSSAPLLEIPADYGFRTYVDDGVAAPVPEPGEWATIAAGLGLVGAVARRRHLSGSAGA